MDEQLKNIWQRLGGLDRLADSFVAEMRYFLEQTPAINADDGRKQSTVEREHYASVAEQCDKLLKALGQLPELDRLNVLSLRGYLPESGDRAVPICDPLDYITTVKENAQYRAEQLKNGNVSKFSRQLYALRDFINRFPPAREINRSQFIELATALWPLYAGSVNASGHGKNIESAVDRIGRSTLKLP